LHLEAAEGWLGLGDYNAANDEVDQITPQFRTHPDVLSLRCSIYIKAERWEMAAEIARELSDLVPDELLGHYHLADALHMLGRTKEAQETLIAVADKFPDDPMVAYNLACFACQLGKKKEAIKWLERAINKGGKEDICTLALNDPDLEPMWAEIEEI
jgi:predicted Zn-dependent protease